LTGSCWRSTGKRYDVIMSSMTASDERKKTVDFVEYFNAGSGSWSARQPEGDQSADDLCARRSLCRKARRRWTSSSARWMRGRQDKKCKDAARWHHGAEVRTDPEAVAGAGVGSRLSAEMADFPVAAYSAQQSNGALEIRAEPDRAGPIMASP